MPYNSFSFSKNASKGNRTRVFDGDFNHYLALASAEEKLSKRKALWDCHSVPYVNPDAPQIEVYTGRFFSFSGGEKTRFLKLMQKKFKANPQGDSILETMLELPPLGDVSFTKISPTELATLCTEHYIPTRTNYWINNWRLIFVYGEQIQINYPPGKETSIVIAHNIKNPILRCFEITRFMTGLREVSNASFSARRKLSQS